jgi:anti-sigma factor RsiW
LNGPENVEDLIPAYAAGELSEEEARRVEAALEGSPRLREELRRYERLFVLLSAAAAEEVRAPRSLEARVAAQVALRAYLKAAAGLAGGLLGDYGRALIYYLRLA